MRRRAVLGLTLLLLATAVGGACGGGSGDGDPAAFCERLDRLTRNDPFQAFGDSASPEDIEAAFTALVARADDLVDVAPPAARAAAREYADAAAELDSLLAGAGYVGTQVDAEAYREQQVAYVAAGQRLERYLEAEC
jgi:hypothetical protein